MSLNNEKLVAFKEWLQEQSARADKLYAEAEESSQIEEYWLGASDTLDDVIYELDKICQK